MGEEWRLGFLVYTLLHPPLPERARELASRRDRLDIVARVLLAALYHHGVRAEDRFFAVYFEAKRPWLAMARRGCLPRTLEETEAYHIIVDLVRRRGECWETVKARGFGEALTMLREAGFSPVLLSSSGRDIAELGPGHRYLYVLGSSVDPPAGPWYDRVASVGPREYLASHVALFINLLYDMGFPWGCEEG